MRGDALWIMAAKEHRHEEDRRCVGSKTESRCSDGGTGKARASAATDIADEIRRRSCTNKTGNHGFCDYCFIRILQVIEIDTA